MILKIVFKNLTTGEIYSAYEQGVQMFMDSRNKQHRAITVSPDYESYVLPQRDELVKTGADFFLASADFIEVDKQSEKD